VKRACIVLSTFLSLAAGAAAAQIPWHQEWASTLAAARKEGVVTVSGPPGIAEREAVLGGWQKAYPDIRIDYTGARGTQILSKVVRERQSGLYNWDIVLASTDPTVFMLPPIHALAPLGEALIDPALADDKFWIGGFAEGFVDDARKFFYSATGSTGTGLGYVNRDCVPRDAFSRSDDLMKPEFKGKIASSDPLLPGIGSRGTWRLSIDKGEAWLKNFYDEASIRQVNALQAKIQSWGVVK
jgi:iron(III) transport system substrate-binding protein